MRLLQTAAAALPDGDAAFKSLVKLSLELSAFGLDTTRMGFELPTCLDRWPEFETMCRVIPLSDNHSPLHALAFSPCLPEACLTLNGTVFLCVQTGEYFPHHPVTACITTQSAEYAAATGCSGDEWVTVEFDTACKKKILRRVRLTHGLFIWACATCEVQVGFSLMDRSEGPSTFAKTVLVRFWEKYGGRAVCPWGSASV